MCLIVEHARAKTKIIELESEIKRLKDQHEPELPSEYPIFEIDWVDLVTELKDLGIDLMLKPEHLPDSSIKYTDEEGWRKISPFLTYPAELYVEGVADCDDYARWATADSSKKFKLNGCLECWGDSKWGYHAYSLKKIGYKEYRISEPNAGAPWAGELLKFGEHNYFPKYWRL